MAFAGIPGATDKVPASTLIVPFFEVGIDVATHPHDTLLVLTDTYTESVTFHYHVWDIDGNPTELYGHVTLSGLESWSSSMRGLIGSASGAIKDMLTQGPFYRGFVTIDIVNEETPLNPTQTGYPFSTTNCLEGYIYYVRLLEGSSNGMTAISIEYVGFAAKNYVRDFYQAIDRKEEIDSEGRTCAETLAKGGTCYPDDYIQSISFRVFPDSGNNASSRIIIFTWRPGTIYGPSIWCDTHSFLGCPSSYTYRMYDKAGNILVDDFIRLDHVVNIIDVSGTQSSHVSILNMFCSSDYQLYAFSINAANPPPGLGMNASWDAIFESYILP